MLDGVKYEEASEATAATWLDKLINEGLEKNFQDYYCSHDLDMQRKYMPATAHMKRESRFRASKAGECPQKQAYTAFFESGVVNPMDRVTEKPEPARKRLIGYIGTWHHTFWHCFFDYLEHLKLVTTLASEEMRYDKGLNLSGTIDRLIQFEYCGEQRKVILDFKTIRPEAYNDPPSDQYVKQQHAYFLLGFQADAAMILYEDKGHQFTRCVDIPRYEPMIEMLRDQYAMMNTWVDQMIAYHKTHDPKFGVKERIKLPVLTDQCPGCQFKREGCHTVEHPEILDKIREGVVADGVF